jgi:hypothetical protein
MQGIEPRSPVCQCTKFLPLDKGLLFQALLTEISLLVSAESLLLLLT